MIPINKRIGLGRTIPTSTKYAYNCPDVPLYGQAKNLLVQLGITPPCKGARWKVFFTLIGPIAFSFDQLMVFREAKKKNSTRLESPPLAWESWVESSPVESIRVESSGAQPLGRGYSTDLTQLDFNPETAQPLTLSYPYSLQ